MQKIRAAAEARGHRDFFIVARTDALAVLGMDEAVDRILAARQAGADASFIEAPGSVEELAEIGRRVPRPMVANMIEGGKTPVLPRDPLGGDGLSTDPLSPGRAVRGGKGNPRGLRAGLSPRYDKRRVADDLRGVQRVDRRGGEIRPGGTVSSILVG